MHRAFTIREVAHEVFYTLHAANKSASLAAVAQTCKILQDPALDVLWHQQLGLLPLLKILPTAIEQVNVEPNEDDEGNDEDEPANHKILVRLSRHLNFELKLMTAFQICSA